MCWCDPQKRQPWCDNCHTVRPDLVPGYDPWKNTVPEQEIAESEDTRFYLQTSTLCSRCNGTGRQKEPWLRGQYPSWTNQCSECDGFGRVSGRQQIELEAVETGGFIIRLIEPAAIREELGITNGK